MEYKIVIKDGYVLGVGQVPSGGNITKERYDAVSSVIANMPTAEDGYCYRLTEAMEWELCERMTEATEGDYLAALERFGVND